MLLYKLAKGIIAVGCVCLLQTNVNAQDMQAPDTLRLEPAQAEKLFLENNLQLLAQHYNIQSARALIEQARKWDNPTLITDQNVYSNGQFFQHGNDINGNPQGQFFVQLQQLIRTAGKRNKQVSLASTNADIAEWEFRNTMRTLRSTVLRDFYTIAQLQGNAVLYTENMQRLEHLLAARAAELQAGNIARKEYLRIEALIVSLRHDITDNTKSLSDVESELKTLLQVTGNTFIQPVVPDAESTDVPQLNIAALTDTARFYNPEYNQEIGRTEYNRTNLALQKALAVPDITVGPEFDQNSNYAPNYFGLGISLPIPLWDRNQGNIRSARYQVKQQEATTLQAEQKLENDVLNAYQKMVYTMRSEQGIDPGFYRDYYQLQKNITESYNKRLISLIEFLDFYNDYQEVRKKQLQQVLNIRLAKEELNYTVGKDIVH
jgi:cobalt-zinc-cadmium efflux system outer membrane protein